MGSDVLAAGVARGNNGDRDQSGAHLAANKSRRPYFLDPGTARRLAVSRCTWALQIRAQLNGDKTGSR